MLRPEEDAFGQVITDFHAGKEVYEIVERDDGNMDVGRIGPAFYFLPYKKWSKAEREAIRFARGRVLDIGCGAGRVCLHLQEKGHDVVGIDNSPLAIKTCRQRGVKQAKLLSITQVDKKLGTFDTIVMYGNNFGLFGGPGRAKWLLRKFHKLTSPQGRIIAQSLDPYATHMPEHTSYHKSNIKRGRMAGQVRLRLRYKKYKTPWFDYFLVSQKEMQELLAGTGWKASKFFVSDSIYAAALYCAVIEKE